MNNKHFFRFTICKPNREPYHTVYRRKLEPWEYSPPWWLYGYVIITVIMIFG